MVASVEHRQEPLPPPNGNGAQPQPEDPSERGREPVARPCARPGCRAPARATLQLRYKAREAVLGPLAPDSQPYAYDLCARHAGRTTPPRDWELVDERDGGATSHGGHAGPTSRSQRLAVLSAVLDDQSPEGDRSPGGDQSPGGDRSPGVDQSPGGDQSPDDGQPAEPGDGDPPGPEPATAPSPAARHW